MAVIKAFPSKYLAHKKDYAPQDKWSINTTCEAHRDGWTYGMGGSGMTNTHMIIVQEDSGPAQCVPEYVTNRDGKFMKDHKNTATLETMCHQGSIIHHRVKHRDKANSGTRQLNLATDI